MTAIPDPTSQRDDAPRWVSLVWSDYFQALVARCPSPCDDDCEQVNDGIVCHEGHQPRHKQMHDVEACVERQRGWRTYSTATTFIPIGAVVTRPVVPLAEKDEAMRLEQRYETLRRDVTEALGAEYDTPEMFGNTSHPTDKQIVSLARTERMRTLIMHNGHHIGIKGFCPDCGVHGSPERLSS